MEHSNLQLTLAVLVSLLVKPAQAMKFVSHVPQDIFWTHQLNNVYRDASADIIYRTANAQYALQLAKDAMTMLFAIAVTQKLISIFLLPV
jgi:hypothetical protein